MKAEYVPSPGELIWINFDPQMGREQGGRRPALVLSLKDYNRKAGLIVCCPVTSKRKGYTFEVQVPPATAKSRGITGAVLADHVKNLDWRERRAEFAGMAPPELVEEVKGALSGLLGLPV